MRFASLAYVFPDTERVDGIRRPFASYELVVSKSADRWKLRLGSAGVVVLKISGRAEQFGADIHDGKRGGGGGPLLYKELRIRGNATGSGDFKGGKYTLVFMGRGNNCLAAENFTRWRIEVTGKGVRYALRGNLVRPSS